MFVVFAQVISSQVLPMSLQEKTEEFTYVIRVASGANSNHFLRLQLGEISNTKKQFLRIYLLEEEPWLYQGLVSESFVLQRLQAYLLWIPKILILDIL